MVLALPSTCMQVVGVQVEEAEGRLLRAADLLARLGSVGAAGALARDGAQAVVCRE